ncbi:MAG: ribonuclease Z [Spirosomaceae bacterium]|jgi:ribonuclease Z|nr:ribonuclease Z [Spirosomataceae bacterium]
MQFSVTILGAGSATPTLTRHPSAQLITYDNDCFLVDCGEGTQFQMLAYRMRPSRLKAVFISHLHGDHYFGLIGLLSSLNLGGRTEDLRLFGPRGLDEILTLHFKLSQTPLQFLVHFQELSPDAPALIFDHPHFTVSTIPLDHRIPCTGFLFREKPRQRNLIKEKLSEDIPFEYLRLLKEGRDVYDESGHLLLGVAEYTLPAPPPRSYAYCSDTRYDERLVEYVRGVNLLYHEATFGDDLAHQATERFHATAREAGIIARKAQVQQLLIGHFSSRYKTFEMLLAQAQEAFSATAIAEEGTTFAVGI